jgi:hypothetical protein
MILKHKLEHIWYKIKMFFKKHNMLRRPKVRSDPHLGVLSR